MASEVRAINVYFFHLIACMKQPRGLADGASTGSQQAAFTMELADEAVVPSIFKGFTGQRQVDSKYDTCQDTWYPARGTTTYFEDDHDRLTTFLDLGVRYAHLGTLDLDLGDGLGLRALPCQPVGCFDLAAARGIRGCKGKAACFCACKGKKQLQAYPGDGTVPSLPDVVGDELAEWKAAEGVLASVCAYDSELMSARSIQAAGHVPPNDHNFEAGPWSCSHCNVVIWRSWAEFAMAKVNLKALKAKRRATETRPPRRSTPPSSPITRTATWTRCSTMAAPSTSPPRPSLSTRCTPCSSTLARLYGNGPSAWLTKLQQATRLGQSNQHPRLARGTSMPRVCAEHPPRWVPSVPTPARLLLRGTHTTTAVHIVLTVSSAGGIAHETVSGRRRNFADEQLEVEQLGRTRTSASMAAE